MKKKYRLIALALSVMLLLAACGGGGAASTAPSAAPSAAPSDAPSTDPTPAVEVKAPADKDELVIGSANEPSSLDPHDVNMVTAFMVDKHIFDRLFVSDNTYKISNSLAKEHEWIDDTTLRVKLVEGVKFTDGDPLTAEDVVYSIKRACAKPQSATAFGPFDAENTVAVDEYTVDIKLKYAYPNALTVLAGGRACIVSQKSIEEMGEANYGRAPVGSGPFKVVKWNSGDRTTLTRNDDYWGAKSEYKDLTIRWIADNTARSLELETGGIDIAIEVPATDVPRLEENPELKIVKGAGSTMSHVVINAVNFDTLKDIRVREAMHKALDMEALVDVVYKGYAEVATSLAPSVTTNYAKVGPETYDLEGAKKLIEESGFDTTQTIPFYIYKNAEIEAAAEIMCNMWKQIGLNVEIVIMDRAAMVTNNGQGKTSFYISGVTASDGNIESVFRMWETPSYGFTDDEQLRSDLTAAKGIVDDAERKAEYARLQEVAWNKHTVFPISVNTLVYGLAGYVENFQFHPDKMGEFTGITFNK